MNKAIYRISLDIHDTGSQVSLSVKKGDTARSIHIILTEKGKPYKIAEGCFATLSGKKADGNYLYNDCIIKDNIIIYDFTKQTTPVVGKVDCEVNLYDANGDNITSPHFVLMVEDKVYNGEEIESSPEATALIQAVFQAEEAAEKAKKSAEEANQSANSAQTSAEVAEDLLAAKEDKLPVITELRLDPTKTPIGCVRYKAGADFSITAIVSRDNEIEEISYNTHYRISNGSIITVYHESIPFFGKQRHKIIVTLDTTWNVDSSSYVCGNLKYTAEVNSDGSFTDGNFIYETYATKEEIVGTLGTINEVLATLVEVE